MAQFVAGEPHTTEVPRIVVDAGLPPGLHRFRLVVANDAGRSSPADEVTVQIVQETVQPTPQPTSQPILRPATDLSLQPTVRTLRRTPRTPQ